MAGVLPSQIQLRPLALEQGCVKLARESWHWPDRHSSLIHQVCDALKKRFARLMVTPRIIKARYQAF
jgi:hypothetical protein